MIKLLGNVGQKEAYLNIIKAIYKEPTTNISATPIEFISKTGIPTIPIFLNNLLKILAETITYEKKVKGVQSNTSKNKSPVGPSYATLWYVPKGLLLYKYLFSDIHCCSTHIR